MLRAEDEENIEAPWCDLLGQHAAFLGNRVPIEKIRLMTPP